MQWWTGKLVLDEKGDEMAFYTYIGPFTTTRGTFTSVTPNLLISKVQGSLCWLWKYPKVQQLQ